MNFKKYFKSKSFSEITLSQLKRISSVLFFLFILVMLFVAFEIYVPFNPGSHEDIIFTVERGWSDDLIAEKLKEAQIIRSKSFFSFYVISTLKYKDLQAGEYSLSPRMSIYKIASKMARGDVAKDVITILEGWSIKDIAIYMERKGICTVDYFINLAKNDYSENFEFLDESVGGKPRKSGLEGYLFPDTYQISKGDKCEDVILLMLANFGKKIEPLKEDIKNKNKTIFEIITMASIIEKEVGSINDKKIVSGIFWKRLKIGMPLQSCATINYITGKNNPAALLSDIKIDSPYNTYKYSGLPTGPISNPGIDSIEASIYPKESNYLYFLFNKKTIFSETLEQHNQAMVKSVDG